jgi:hypothetical protein
MTTNLPQHDPRNGRPRHRHVRFVHPNKRLELWRQQEERYRGIPSAIWPEAIDAANNTVEKFESLISLERTRGKDVLEEMLELFTHMMMVYAPHPPDAEPNPTENRQLFDRYTMLAIKCAEAVAPYQSMKAVYVKHAPQDDGFDLTLLSDAELAEWRRLVIKATRGQTIEAQSSAPSKP